MRQAVTNRDPRVDPIPGDVLRYVGYKDYKGEAVILDVIAIDPIRGVFYINQNHDESGWMRLASWRDLVRQGTTIDKFGTPKHVCHNARCAADHE